MRPAIAFVATLAFVGGVLAGLGYLGGEARSRLAPRDRYRIRFVDIECDAPPGVSRETFLMEVRYTCGEPETIQLLDPELTAILTTAFASHPWVEAVEAVECQPPRRVCVQLRFRTPVLAVKLTSGERRWVDGKAVLLPVSDITRELPELIAEVNEPPSPTGQVWSDPTVKRAVELVRAYSPKRLEKTAVGWRLTLPDGKVMNVGN